MYILKNICFVCLTDSAKNLNVVYKNEISTHVKYVLPEIQTLDLDAPVYICTACSITISFFHTFKNKCLKNYSQWKHYIKTLQKTSDTQPQSQLKIRVVKCKSKINKKRGQIIELNINVQNKDQLQSSNETEKHIFSDSQINIYDNTPLVKQEEVDTNATLLEDNNIVTGLDAEEEQIFTIKLNIEDENEDEFLSSNKRNGPKKTIENNIKEETNSINETDSQTIQILSGVQQNGGSSEVNNALDNRETNSINEFKCILCNEIFSDKTAFRTHSINHINSIKGLKCLVCNRKFVKSETLKRHMQFHLDIKSNECSICKKKYVCRRSFNFHLKTHAGSKDFECAICSKKFFNKRSLKLHIKTHTAIRKFECTLCNKKFFSMPNLRKHRKRHLDPELVKKYECSICNKKYSDKSTLKTHMKFHLNIRNYECKICKKAFVKNSHLKNHMMYHVDKQYECSVCKKKFYTKSLMNKHFMKLHESSQADQ